MTKDMFADVPGRDVTDRSVDADRSVNAYAPRCVANDSAKSHPTASSATPLMVSVVIPVRNEASHIRETLEMLVQQDYPVEAFEILVVDGRSTDDTRSIVMEFVDRGTPVRLLDNPLCWSSAARNIGARAARGEIVLVIDGHCQLPDRQHLRHVVSAFERSGADIVGRPQPLDVHDATPLQEAIALARASRLGHHPDSFIYSREERYVPAQSVGAAYRRHVFERIGYFDERFDACEDVDFNYRADQAGLQCFLSWDARVMYYPRSSLVGLFRQLARYGRGRVRLARKHSHTWSLKSLAPAALVAFLLGGPLAVLAGTNWAILWLIVVGLYLCVILIESVTIGWQQSFRRAVWWVPCVLLTIHTAAGYGLLWELVAGSPSRSTFIDDCAPHGKGCPTEARHS